VRIHQLKNAAPDRFTTQIREADSFPIIPISISSLGGDRRLFNLCFSISLSVFVNLLEFDPRVLILLTILGFTPN